MKEQVGSCFKNKRISLPYWIKWVY